MTKEKFDEHVASLWTYLRVPISKETREELIRIFDVGYDIVGGAVLPYIFHVAPEGDRLTVNYVGTFPYLASFRYSEDLGWYSGYYVYDDNGTDEDFWIHGRPGCMEATMQNLLPKLLVEEEVCKKD